MFDQSERDADHGEAVGMWSREVPVQIDPLSKVFRYNWDSYSWQTPHIRGRTMWTTLNLKSKDLWRNFNGYSHH